MRKMPLQLWKDVLAAAEDVLAVVEDVLAAAEKMLLQSWMIRLQGCKNCKADDGCQCGNG